MNSWKLLCFALQMVGYDKFFILALPKKIKMNEKFPSSEKLKSKILIDSLFTEGRSIKIFPLKLIYLPIEDTSAKTCKTGVSVPKRNFKKAVDRNYFKRLMREVFRKNKYLVEDKQGQKFALMFIYISWKRTDFQKLNEVVVKILRKLNEKEAAHETSNS